jgi:hypothetical protein
VQRRQKERLEKRAETLGITPEELVKRRQRRKDRTARKQREYQNKRQELTKTQETLAELYSEKYTTFDALRVAMVRNGIVEHRISAYDVIQRAIDDTFTDYALMRQRIERDSHGDILAAVEHPLYPYMEKAREAMVRYSTFAMQYDIQLRQLRLSEARVGILAATLRNVLQTLGLDHDQIQQVPKLLIEEMKGEEKDIRQSKLDEKKAEAIAEILANDSEVEILDATPQETEVA